jgi:hypothetical protein
MRDRIAVQLLPNPRNQAVPRAFRELAIAVQVFLQKTVFCSGADDENDR